MNLSEQLLTSAICENEFEKVKSVLNDSSFSNSYTISENQIIVNMGEDETLGKAFSFVDKLNESAQCETVFDGPTLIITV